MKVYDFKIPGSLCQLIDDGVWPDENSSINRQEREPLISKEVVQRIFPDFDKIVLMKPPFHTIGDEAKVWNDFWVTFLTNFGEIDYDKAVVIADFGLGSDSVIILYYESTNLPVVMYLNWPFVEQKICHSWVKTHDSFDSFIKDIDL